MNPPTATIDGRTTHLTVSVGEAEQRLSGMLDRWDRRELPDSAKVEVVLGDLRRVWEMARGLARGPVIAAPEPIPIAGVTCTPADKFARCNFKKTGRLNSCRDLGGCLSKAPSTQQK